MRVWVWYVHESSVEIRNEKKIPCGFFEVERVCYVTYAFIHTRNFAVTALDSILFSLDT